MTASMQSVGTKIFVPLTAGGKMIKINPKAFAKVKPSFHVGKIPDDREFHFFSTVSDFADISGNRQNVILDSSDITSS